MTLMIRVREERSGLDCRLALLRDVAPRSAEALWAIAGLGQSFDAIHAMWTGPEISCPVAEPAIAGLVDLATLPLENATSYPAAGEIALVPAVAGRWKGMPPHGFLDIGLFYGDGARLLMPMGWIMGSVCARVVPEDEAALRAGCAAIRRAGACKLSFDRIS